MNNSEFRILIVDDEKEYRKVLSTILLAKGYTVDSVMNGDEALTNIYIKNYSLILTDLVMSGMNGIELLKKIKEYDKSLEVIIVTGYGSINNAVDAMKKGAFSYYIKSNSPEELIGEIEKIKEIIKTNEIYSGDTFNGKKFMLETKNKKFKKVLKIAKKASKSNVNILILGESGVGKEVIANYIHENSKRHNEVFMPVNCHAYSKGVLESELFGHEKGSFTGAVNQKLGKFELANKGTIFLDEIGELSKSMQVKLLRVIDTKTIERVGGSEHISLDYRLITATNRDLLNCEEKLFRDDLFYRISTIILKVPSLRERQSDLPKLIDFFIGKSSNKLGIDIVKIDKNVIEYLLDYDFPGNIRELKNIIERLVVLSENGVISKNTLFIEDEDELLNDDEKRKSLKEFRSNVESKYIKKIINDCNGNITEASKVLNISRRQLYNKINEYGL
ncbi:MAG: sigma-54 dependent transcriptional regulator [Bacillota bacterium]|nr:sigma-54 dependent transcriptional regulator [Bacillota bacterium]